MKIIPSQSDFTIRSTRSPLGRELAIVIGAATAIGVTFPYLERVVPDTRVLDAQTLRLIGLGISGFGSYALYTKGTAIKAFVFPALQESRLRRIIDVAAFFILYRIMMFLPFFLNMKFDMAREVGHSTTVRNVAFDFGRKAPERCYLEVASWRPPRREEQFEIDVTPCLQIRSGATITVNTSAGLLGFEWVTSVNTSGKERAPRQGAAEQAQPADAVNLPPPPDI